MMAAPSVSAIICTYKRDDSLCEAVRAVLSQDYAGSVEVIVVDQSDSHVPEVESFLRLQAGRLRLIQQAEPNLPQARNAGIEAASGELLLFVDDDVILARHAVSRLAGHFQNSAMKGVGGIVVSERDPEAWLRYYARKLGVANVETAQGPKRVDGFIGALMMVSAKAVRAVEGFDSRLGRLTPTAYGEDNDFCRRLRRAGASLWIDPSVRVLHKDHLAGGCESRKTDPELARRYHMKSMVYIRLKHHGHLGAGGWLQLSRAYLLNRSALSGGPRRVLQNFAAVRSAIREVRAFMAEGKEIPAAHVRSPRRHSEAAFWPKNLLCFHWIRKKADSSLRSE